jgi:hypothetical protein
MGRFNSFEEILGKNQGFSTNGLEITNGEEFKDFDLVRQIRGHQF